MSPSGQVSTTTPISELSLLYPQLRTFQQFVIKSISQQERCFGTALPRRSLAKQRRRAWHHCCWPDPRSSQTTLLRYWQFFGGVSHSRAFSHSRVSGPHSGNGSTGAGPPMKLKVSKGVLSKNGTPWAAGTIHAVRVMDGEKWNCPYPYSMASLVLLLVDKRIESICIIDKDNQQMDLTDLRG